MLDQRAARFDFNPDCIEEIFMRNFQSERAKTISQLTCPAMNALGDCAQTARSVIDRVHRGDHGEKNLCCANVAGRFVAADVLLSRLQRESIGRPAFSVMGNANETTRHVTFVLIARSEVGGVRTTETERNTKALRVADGNVRAEFARRL